jgi:hypothetical protein
LQAAARGARRSIGAVEHRVTLGVVYEDFSDLAVLVREEYDKVLGGCAATQDQERR